jgi:acid phosphatase (class A)
LEALVLIMMVPENRDAILTRADDYAHSRVVCGVHYPTDVEASKSGRLRDDRHYHEQFAV